MSLPFFINFVPAGFPSPADYPFEIHLDLSKHIIHHPNTTCYFKVFGYEMVRAGINPSDLLVVDAALNPKHRDIIIALLNGEIIIRRLHLEDDRDMMVPLQA